MSLINEALKKAQAQRPTATESPPAAGPAVGAPQPHPQPHKRHNTMWGFLIVIIFVGILSAGMATFLVWQILDPGDSDATAADQPEGAQAPAEVVVETTAPQEMPVQAPAGNVDEAIQPLAESQPEPPAAAPPIEPVASRIPPIVEEEPVVLTKPAVGKPNPEVWNRLEKIEIRGIMSGGAKVLIYDIAAGKTKTLAPGDMFDGGLGLKVASISTNAIVFEDHGGIQHTKSF